MDKIMGCTAGLEDGYMIAYNDDAFLQAYGITNKVLKNNGIFESSKEIVYDDTLSFQDFGIKDNDRLRNYQFVKKYWDIRMSFSDKQDKDMINKEQINLLKIYWKKSFKQSLEEAKLFVIDEDVIPMLLYTECKEGHLPFPSIFIDAQVQIQNRTYFGFHVGSYYTEKIEYKAIITAYSKYIKQKGEMVKIVIPDFILLTKSTEEDLPFRTHDSYHNKIRNFIFSFCAFINEPDVSIILNPLNPKNNIRRVQRGILPLPEYRKTVIHGKLRNYIDRQKQESQGKNINHRYWVRGFYRHFFNKKRYSKLYSLDNDILRKWIKPFIKGQGILIKQSWNVKE